MAGDVICCVVNLTGACDGDGCAIKEIVGVDVDGVLIVELLRRDVAIVLVDSIGVVLMVLIMVWPVCPEKNNT